MSDTATAGRYAFYDFKPDLGDMASEILAGLATDPKRVSPKFFYDERGSKLFEEITRLEEYYLTRTEMALFDAHLGEIAAMLGDELCLIEYGSGSSLKIRRMLEAITPVAYVPVDISHAHLQDNARALHKDFPTLEVFPVCADFSEPITLPEEVAGLTAVGFFPGSSIGNFDPDGAHAFLSVVRQEVGAGGALIIGVDRKKPVEVLEAAYNDARGVTAAFNLNVLHHINEELDADFDVAAYEHFARYNSDAGCIQMFLRANSSQDVSVAGERVTIAAGETLHTENSYKYHPEEFVALASSAGFDVAAAYTDERDWFSLFLLTGV